MPYTAPTVNYSTAVNNTYTTLTGIESVSIMRGRVHFQDPYPQSSCVIELIPATSYTTPLAIGQYVDVRATNSSTANCYFQGRITDVERSYAMPYNAGTNYAPLDRIRITATGGTGILGAYQLTNYETYEQPAYPQIDNLCYYASVKNYGYEPVIGGYNGPMLSAHTFTGSGLDLMNLYLRSIIGSIDDVATRTETLLGVRPFDRPGNTGFTFADTGAVGTRKFVNLEFLSSVQNTFNQINVEVEGFATQTASGTAPYNSLNYSTYNGTTAESSAQAGYLLNLLSGQLQACPYVIGVNNVADNGIVEALLKMANADNLPMSHILQSAATVIFRGVTSEGIIQGVSGVFYPDRATAQVYLSPSLGQPFILDSTIFGLLDTNRLGYP